jgi:hypothetical protein
VPAKFKRLKSIFSGSRHPEGRERARGREGEGKALPGDLQEHRRKVIRNAQGEEVQEVRPVSWKDKLCGFEKRVTVDNASAAAVIAAVVVVEQYFVCLLLLNADIVPVL